MKVKYSESQIELSLLDGEGNALTVTYEVISNRLEFYVKGKKVFVCSGCEADKAASYFRKLHEALGDIPQETQGPQPEQLPLPFSAGSVRAWRLPTYSNVFGEFKEGRLLKGPSL